MAELCPHCLEQRPEGAEFCPNCGGARISQNDSRFLPVGTVLNGSKNHSFLIGKVIGSGGFGITYIGKETLSNRLVAIKEYFPLVCKSVRQGLGVAPTVNREAYDHGLKSFLREASMLRAVVNIPSIVHVLDCFETGNTAYMVMDYLNGVTLRGVTDSRGAIPFYELLPKLRVLMNGLEELHNAGVLHRDIAPDNIMLMPDGNLRLLDFGCARSMEDGRAMTVILKPGFAPIEQYQTRGQGRYSDIYALCATIYYCITGGKVPAGAPERIAAQSGGTDPLIKPSALGAKISYENEQALLWGLAIRPENRPQRISDLAARFIDEPDPNFYAKIEPTPYTAPTSCEPASAQSPISMESPAEKPAESAAKTEGFAKKLFKNKPAMIAASAAAVFLIVAVVAIFARGGKAEKKPSGGGYAPSPQTAARPADLDEDPELNSEPRTVEYQNYVFEIVGKTASLVSYTGSEQTVRIPDKYSGAVIINIRAGAFDDVDAVEKVVLPDDLKTIEDGAFTGCDGLFEIETSSGAAANSPFKDCPNLRVITYDGDKPDWKSEGDISVFPKEHKEEVFFYSASEEPSQVIIDRYYVDGDDVLYGINDVLSYAVVLDIPAEIEKWVIPESIDGANVSWISDGAFGRVGEDFELVYTGDATACMSADSYENIKYSIGDLNGLAKFYISDGMLVEICDRINDARGGDGPHLWMDEEYSTLAITCCNHVAFNLYESEEQLQRELIDLINEDYSDRVIYFNYFANGSLTSDFIDQVISEIVELYTDAREYSGPITSIQLALTEYGGSLVGFMVAE